MIISISGKANSGKDLVGKIIQWCLSPADQEEGWEFDITDDYDVAGIWKIKKFAGIPNEAYKLITGVDFHKLSREDKELEREGFRSFCEILKEWNSSDIWINALMINYRQGFKNAPKDWETNWIITDVRFPNEYKAIQKKEHLHIHIERDTGIVDNHSSENTFLLKEYFDENVVYLQNNSSIEELIKRVKNILVNNKII